MNISKISFLSIFFFSDSPIFSVPITGVIGCGSSIYDYTTAQSPSHYYIFKITIPDNVISIDALRNVDWLGFVMVYPLLHLRTLNQTLLYTSNDHMFLYKWPIGTYILEITSPVFSTGAYNIHITCIDTNSPTAAPTHTPTLITISPTNIPSNHPSTPTLPVPSESPTS